MAHSWHEALHISVPPEPVHPHPRTAAAPPLWDGFGSFRASMNSAELSLREVMDFPVSQAIKLRQDTFWEDVLIK